MNQTFLRLPFAFVLLLSLPALAWAAGVTAPVTKTGQTTQYAVGDDGNYSATKGAAWPIPRFTNNNDGTVTDNLTGLIWLENTLCWGGKIWAEALPSVATLKNGMCGLSDGSALGEWRLPSINELRSLIASQYFAPALANTAGTGQRTSNDPFYNIQFVGYFSSTTRLDDTARAWCVDLNNGAEGGCSKALSYGVWPVRGGQ